MKKNVLISTNYNPLYFQFVPIVTSAWKSMGFNPILTLVTNRSYKEWKWLEEYAEIRHWNIRKDLNEGIWSKVSRIITYDTPLNEKQMVSDIDMIPLNKEYFESLFNYDDNKLVLGSSDSHSNLKPPEGGENHKFAGCYMIAKGNTWKEIINPDSLSYDDLINSWKGIKKYDHHEDITQPYNIFSEESLIRRLVYMWNPNKEKMIMLERGWTTVNNGMYGVANRRIDRSMSNWEWDLAVNSLDKNFWIDCHSKRPIKDHYDKILPIVDYLGLDRKLLDIGIEKSKI